MPRGDVLSIGDRLARVPLLARRAVWWAMDYAYVTVGQVAGMVRRGGADHWEREGYR